LTGVPMVTTMVSAPSMRVSSTMVSSTVALVAPAGMTMVVAAAV